MPSLDQTGPLQPGDAGDALRAAFRELHGRRLHGFALLLTLGERAAAAALTSEALAAGERQVDALRHPERAAAWLRARVTRSAARLALRRAPLAPQRGALTDLGADEAVIAGLAALSTTSRAALVAAGIERLDRRDVATVVGADGARLESLLRRARGRYAAAHARSGAAGAPSGPIVSHVTEIARRAMS